MKYKKTTLILGAIVAFLFFVGNKETQAKYINHSTTPTEIRGNWYCYESTGHKLNHMYIGKHYISTNGKKDKQKLYVVEKFKRTYQMYKYKYGGDIPLFKLITNKKIKGKHPLETGGGMAVYWVRTKAHKTYFM